MDALGLIDWILLLAMMTAWSSFDGAPVPSMTRTWLRTNTGKFTFTKDVTSVPCCVWPDEKIVTNKKTMNVNRHISFSSAEHSLQPQRFSKTEVAISLPNCLTPFVAWLPTLARTSKLFLRRSHNWS